MNNTTVESDPREWQRHAALVDVKGIVKRFGGNVVVHNVSLLCRPGEVVLVLGANGAGKSTLLRIIAGLERADRGRVQLPAGVKVGYAGHHTGLYSKLSVAANVALYAALAGVSESERDELVRTWRLDDVQHKPVADVSRGAQSKASLVRALLPKPQLLLLDEPTSNLDEGATELLKKVLSERAATGAVALVATHDLARLQSIATRVIVMERGVLIADSGCEYERDAIDSVVERYRISNR